MKKVLVIGASGLVGSRAVELGQERFQVFGTYLNHPLKGENYFKLNTSDRPAAFSLMEEVKPDLVLDTHALHNVDYCETHGEEAWASNVEGTKNVAEAAKRMGAKYAFVSTDYVFDGSRLNYTEKDKPHPLNYYGRTKLAAELVLDALEINHFTVRTSTIFGAGGSGKQSFVLWLLDKLGKGEEATIVSDQHSNPTLADNLVELAYRLLSWMPLGCFTPPARTA